MNYDYKPVGPIVAASNIAGVDATIATTLIPPWSGSGDGPPLLYTPSSSKKFGPAYTHVTLVCYTNGDTAHALNIMRPKNYTWLTVAIAANGTGLTIYDDPGVYSTNYKYATNITTGTATVANNTIATNDWVALQLVDGTWHKSMIASGTFGGGNLVLTTAVPNVTGGGAAIGAPVYFFGAAADKDPATGLVDPGHTVAAVATSLAQYKGWSDTTGSGIAVALHRGDPMLFYDPNTTHLGTLEFISGFHALN